MQRFSEAEASPTRESHGGASPEAGAVAPHRIVEIGWIVAGHLDKPDADAVLRARDSISERLRRDFSEFVWKMPLIYREEIAAGAREEPVILLDQAVLDRDARHWDYAVLITSADLVSHYGPFAFAVLSRSLEVAVISTARIDPQAQRTESGLDAAARTDRMARRIETLLLHEFGHLNGLPHHDDPRNLMYELRGVEDLDGMNEFQDEQRTEIFESLRETADQRLEERESFERANPWRFYLQTLWHNRHDIGEAIANARPWQFPIRLSRLSAAALSTMLILLMTAEVWDLGMTQSGTSVTVLAMLTMAATTTYVVVRQQLLLHRERRYLTEQGAVKNIAACSIVLAGMLTMFVLLYVLTLLLSLVLFDAVLVREWAAALQNDVRPTHYLMLAGFIASIGIAIGALGASFEEHLYFRHITYVDEET